MQIHDLCVTPRIFVVDPVHFDAGKKLKNFRFNGNPDTDLEPSKSNQAVRKWFCKKKKHDNVEEKLIAAIRPARGICDLAQKCRRKTD
jgi:hypothetical protein